MEFQFTGKITEIRPVRTGSTEKGEWANAEFEVTENGDTYPQVALFDFFKNGEHVKYAKEFAEHYKVGDEVTVSFNHKKNTYTNKENKVVNFYKTSAWKVEKIGASQNAPSSDQFEPAQDLKDEDYDDLPF